MPLVIRRPVFLKFLPTSKLQLNSLRSFGRPSTLLSINLQNKRRHLILLCNQTDSFSDKSALLDKFPIQTNKLVKMDANALHFPTSPKYLSKKNLISAPEWVG